MPVQLKIDTSAMRAVEATMRDLAREYGPRNSIAPLRSTGRNAMKPLVPIVRANTPVVSGHLRDSTAMQARTRNGVVTVAVGWIFRRVRNETLTAAFRRGAGITKALGVEFGNRRVRGQAILQRIARQQSQGIIDRFARGFDREFDKAVRRWTRRRSQGKFRVR